MISVLIPHYNDERIYNCISQINSLSFRDKIKIIVQDSNSSEEYQKKIKNSLNENDIFQSKKDEGIFDGLNSLLKLVDTPFFTWIGCDDYINEDYNYNSIIEKFNNGADIVQSNVIYFDNKIDNVTRRIKAYNNNYVLYSLGLPFYHFGSTIRTSLISNNSLRFDITKKTAADFEFFRVLLKKSRKSSVKANDSTIYLGDGGNSSADFKARFRGYKDIFKSFKNIRIFLLPLFLLVRVFFKLKSVSK
jgi:hypothetical protein